MNPSPRPTGKHTQQLASVHRKAFHHQPLARGTEAGIVLQQETYNTTGPECRHELVGTSASVSTLSPTDLSHSQNCHQQKTKCDRARPACGRCSSLLMPCVFPDIPKHGEVFPRLLHDLCSSADTFQYSSSTLHTCCLNLAHPTPTPCRQLRWVHRDYQELTLRLHGAYTTISIRLPATHRPESTR